MDGTDALQPMAPPVGDVSNGQEPIDLPRFEKELEVSGLMNKQNSSVFYL